MRNHKAMRYFSGSTFQRLPLYKLAMGGIAMVLCAGIGVSAMAAAFIGTPRQTQPNTEAVQLATDETAARPTARPTAAPTATPSPVISVRSEVSVVQQDIGVQLYRMADDSDGQEGTDADLPLIGVELSITITDADGNAADYPVDTESGTVLAEDVEPGDYEISFPDVEGYHMPAPVGITVHEKIEYKADIEAVQDKIVQAEEVVESEEDSSYGGGTVVEDEIVDTVAYAESSKVEIGRRTVYTAELSDGGYLLLTDGSVTAYKPVYDASTGELTGARRDGSARFAAAGGLPGAVGLAGLLRHGSNAPAVTPEAVTQEETGAEATATPAASATPEPTASPTPEPTAAPTPTPTPEPTPEPTPTPAPTAAPTPTPAPTPTATPNDPTAGWPEEIGAADLAGYGFAVTAEEEITYEYTGWQNIGGNNYYYDPATHQPVTGTQVIQGNVYEFAADGALNQTARGIDVSKYQGNIDWNAVAADGITFAIIRVGYRGYGSGALVEDSTFRQNIQGATAAGLRVGVYFYSQAIDEAEAVEEASMVLSLCQGYSLPLGVYFDTEKVAGDTGRADGISAAQRTANAVAFCETIRNAGYNAGVYSYASWFYNSLNFANISKYRIWIAQYRDTLDFGYHYDIWQYTSSGKVNGVPGNVDMNIG